MYQVHIERDFASASYRMYLYQRIVGGGMMLIDSEGRQFAVTPDQSVTHDYRAWARLPEDAAHSLLGELARVLGAVEHPEQLRKDYEHERGRVDKFIEHFMRTEMLRIPPS